MSGSSTSTSTSTSSGSSSSPPPPEESTPPKKPQVRPRKKRQQQEWSPPLSDAVGSRSSPAAPSPPLPHPPVPSGVRSARVSSSSDGPGAATRRGKRLHQLRGGPLALEIAPERAGGTQDRSHKLGRQRGFSEPFSNKNKAPASSVSSSPSSSSGSTPVAAPFPVPLRGQQAVSPLLQSLRDDRRRVGVGRRHRRWRQLRRRRQLPRC
jgi:hypothetical protein